MYMATYSKCVSSSKKIEHKNYTRSYREHGSEVKDVRERAVG